MEEGGRKEFAMMMLVVNGTLSPGLNVPRPQIPPSRVAVEGSEPEPAQELGRTLCLSVGDDEPGSQCGRHSGGKL